MLALMMFLFAAPAGPAMGPTPGAPSVGRTFPPALIIPPPAEDRSVVMCEGGDVQQAFDGSVLRRGQGLQWYSDDAGRIYSGPVEGRVRLYRAMLRQLGDCALPVVAVDRLPDADRAVGRNLGGR